MGLLDRFHEEHKADGQLVVFRCKKCGRTKMSLGSLHAHIETHRGYTRFNIQIPFTKTAMANVDELMRYTSVLRVESWEEVTLSEVEGY